MIIRINRRHTQRTRLITLTRLYCFWVGAYVCIHLYLDVIEIQVGYFLLVVIDKKMWCKLSYG